MVELGKKGERTVTFLPLFPLRQVQLIRGSLKEVLARKSGDYVTVVLTDREDLDILEMQDALRNAFPNLLEIRREGILRAEYEKALSGDREMDPFELCCSLLGEEITEEEKALLMDVINTIKEA